MAKKISRMPRIPIAHSRIWEQWRRSTACRPWP